MNSYCPQNKTKCLDMPSRFFFLLLLLILLVLSLTTLLSHSSFSGTQPLQLPEHTTSSFASGPLHFLLTLPKFHSLIPTCISVLSLKSLL